jgi:hypothetical protein
MADWDEQMYVVHASDKWRAQGQRHWLDLAYDRDLKLTRDTLCMESREDGMVCRRTKGHQGPHVPFDGELVATTGVWVRERWPIRAEHQD